MSLRLALLPQKRVARKRAEHDPADYLLRGKVGLGNQVGGAFLADFDPPGPLLDHLPAGADRLFAHAQIVASIVHVGHQKASV